ncbi:RsmD family RNA methyltransferase, partial [Streptomyces lunaelactis]|uniref:RsmD family RNA methyltransferase n=1 Tax=Streptomyces lunaelactis TaxID=1535768 RepID=UPI0015846176|nr:RsmD family RNA methyltransferase [Streptomyces lunaelactis]
MKRVSAGSAGGRRRAVPAGRDTRPTSDRAREGLFSTSGALLGPLDGLRVADLYAGSGAVGLEALS